MKNISKLFNSLFSKRVLTLSLIISSAVFFLLAIIVFVFLNLKEEFLSFFISDFLNRNSASFIRVFLSSLISNSFYIMPLFLSAMSLMGLILPHLMLGYYTFSVALVASFLYSTYHFSGILYFITVLLPDIFIFFFCLFSASYLSFDKTYVLFFSKLDVSFKLSINSFFKSFLLIFILTVISSAISAGASFLFANLFNF